jgi:hypothetical protein
MRRMVLIAVVVASALFAAQTAPTATTGDTDVLGTTATVDPGSLTCDVPGSYVVSCKTTGFVTAFFGTLVGSSSTDNAVLIDCKTGRYLGQGTETFAGSVENIGSGTLTWRLQFSGTVSPDCSTITSFQGTGVVIGGSDDLAGLHGRLSFEGETYSGSLH